MENYIKHLQDNEEEALISVMAFMSYNPSIGRALEKGGVKRFQIIAVSLVKRLAGLSEKDAFEALHNEYVQKIIDSFKTSKGSRPSYGQAQKPINVFLKVYVDWAAKPDAATRQQLLPLLHVPLDSIIMRTIKKKFQILYDTDIRPRVVPGPQEFSLSKIDREIYSRWQTFFRRMHPEKPILFDIVWAINRN